MQTPEFVCWSLHWDCSPRDGLAGSDPMAVLRQLRALRAYATAAVEQRIVEDVCVQLPPDQVDPQDASTLAFSASEVLRVYGGLNHVQQQCNNCPANSLSPNPALAACCGELVLPTKPADQRSWIAEVQQRCEQPTLSGRLDKHFAKTDPAWYRLWRGTTLDVRQRELHLTVLDDRTLKQAAARWPSLAVSLEAYLRALQQSLAQDLPITVQLWPAARVDGRHWILPAHCPHCKAAAPMAAPRGNCQVCRATVAFEPQRRWMTRGARPYWELRRFLGDSNAQQFLQRYQATARNKSIIDSQPTTAGIQQNARRRESGEHS